jgi:peptide/nickel transport system ATP-binding protein
MTSSPPNGAPAQESAQSPADGDALVRIRNLEKRFSGRRGLFASKSAGDDDAVRAVANVSLDIRAGESLGLVGQSGSGKSTLGLMLALLERPTSGVIEFDGADMANARGATLKSLRRQVQIIFQDPYESLNPRYRIEETLTEPLRIHKIGRGHDERHAIVRAKIEAAGLRPAEKYLSKFPHELSGGERQRVAIARSILCDPRLIVADEPVSMLDVSVRAGLLNLLQRLRDEMQNTYLFITHDLAVARYMCDRIAIMVHGHIVEIGPTEAVLQNPQHAYTRMLIGAVPHADPAAARRARVAGGVESIAVAAFEPEPGARMTEVDTNHFLLAAA